MILMVDVDLDLLKELHEQGSVQHDERSAVTDLYNVAFKKSNLADIPQIVRNKHKIRMWLTFI
jgi:hypothetical protein